MCFKQFCYFFPIPDVVPKRMEIFGRALLAITVCSAPMYPPQCHYVQVGLIELRSLVVTPFHRNCVIFSALFSSPSLKGALPFRPTLYLEKGLHLVIKTREWLYGCFHRAMRKSFWSIH